MNYISIEPVSMLNGDGLRTVLWVAGCTHNCKGCHNPETHNHNAGILFDDAALKTLLDIADKPYIKGITLSGGDPLSVHNRPWILGSVIPAIKERFGDTKDIWVYTGYEFEDFEEEELKDIDVLVCGKFVEELKDVNFKWAGSTNQRIMRKVNNTFVNTSDDGLAVENKQFEQACGCCS